MYLSVLSSIYSSSHLGKPEANFECIWCESGLTNEFEKCQFIFVSKDSKAF